MSTVPLRNALVEIRNQDYVLLSRKYTDENGLAVFSLPKGLYFVKASKKGYYDHEQQVTLTSDFLKEITLQKKAITGEYSGVDPTDIPDTPPEGWDYIHRFNDEIDTRLIDSGGVTDYVLDLENGILHLKPTETESGFGSWLQNMPLKQFATIMKIGDITLEENVHIFFGVVIISPDGTMYGITIKSHDSDSNKLIVHTYPDEVGYEMDKPNDWFIIFVDFTGGRVKIYDKEFNLLFETSFQQFSDTIFYGFLAFDCGFPELNSAYASEILVDWIAFYTGGKKNATIYPSISAYYLDKQIVNFVEDDFPYSVNDILFDVTTNNSNINLTDKTEIYPEAINDGDGFILFSSSGVPDPKYLFLAFKPEILTIPEGARRLIEIYCVYEGYFQSGIFLNYNPFENAIEFIFVDSSNNFSLTKLIPYSEKYYILACVFTGNGKFRLLDFNLNILEEMVSQYAIPNYDLIRVLVYSRKTNGTLETRTYLDWLFFGSE